MSTTGGVQFQNQSRLRPMPVTIASGQTVSGLADIGGSTLVGVLFPAAMTGTSISFKTAFLSTDLIANVSAVYDNAGALVTVTKVNSAVCNVPPANVAAIGRQVAVLSNGTEGADRIVTLIVRDIA